MRRIDSINRRTMGASGVVASYAGRDQLTPPERALLELIRGETRGRAILDLGVGGGRTVAALTDVSRDYVGIDYGFRPDALAYDLAGRRIDDDTDDNSIALLARK